MDLLTHLCLPLAVAYAVRPDLFPTRWHLAIGAAGIVPDLDKLINAPGLFHSLLVTAPLSLAILAVGAARDAREYALLGVGLLHSHLLLDIVDGGPVPLFSPLVREGIGFRYPAQLLVGRGPLGVTVVDPLPVVRVTTTNPQRVAYSPLNGVGVLSVLVFLAIHAGVDDRRAASRGERP